jgi:solute carrier family 25 (mitochondrial carnitine/acylcarnitine transporter), member 20/29
MDWIDVAKDLNAGTVGGVAGIVAGHPLDTVKVRLQTDTPALATRGVFRTLRTIVVHEGPQGLYKGLLSPVLSNAPINAVVFGVQGFVARSIRAATGRDSLTAGQHLVAGASAGCVQTIFAAPSEHVKIQLQVDHGRAGAGESSIDCARRLYRTVGLRGLFRGWEMTLLRDMPAFGIYFYAYEVSKQYLTGGDAARETDTRLLLAGGIAGSTSWFFSQPMDVVKSCVQSQELHVAKSALALAHEKVRDEGAQFFLKGFGATMLRAFPVSAVTFLVYEKAMQWMS